MEFIRYEQVYAIEVEGRHNFVVGHWIDPASADITVGSRQSTVDSGQWTK